VKVLSIRQPWASLIAYGFKDIENRTWRTNYRGPLAIHASSKLDYTPLSEIGREIGVVLPDIDQSRGGIVGVVDLIDCVEQHRSKWFVGPFGFVMASARRVPFLRCVGQLNVYEAPAFIRRHCTTN
jgi:hypothetical protein